VKVLRVICALLLITGACLSGRALYMHAKAELAGILVRRAWVMTKLFWRERRLERWPLVRRTC